MSTTEEQIVSRMTPDEDEQADDDETNETQPDEQLEGEQPEGEQPAPRSQKEIDAVQDKLKSEAARHEKRLREIMGEDFGFLVPNPTDWTPGYIFNIPEMHPLPEQVAALDAIIGRAGMESFEHDPGREPCDVCLGKGSLETGSKVQDQAALPCRFCQGKGWTGEGNPKIQMLAAVQSLPQENGASNLPNQFQVADRWGRPFGHPHYNLEPASVGA